MKRVLTLAIFAIFLAFTIHAAIAADFDARGGKIINVSNLSVSYNLTCSGTNYAATTWGGNYIICTYFNISGGTGTIGPATNGQVAFFNSTNTATGSANLFFNQTTGYLGIGTSTPGSRLDVNGDASLGGNIITYGTGTNILDGGPTRLGTVNISGYVTIDTPSTTDCVDLAAGGSFCSNTTCAWIESPNGNTKVVACN